MWRQRGASRGVPFWDFLALVFGALSEEKRPDPISRQKSQSIMFTAFVQLSQNVNSWEEQENGEMDVTYDSSNNNINVILIRRNIIADGGYN